MTKEQFINAMGDIDDKFIKKIHCSCEEQCEFDPNDDKPQIMRPTGGNSNTWKFAVSAAAVVIVLAAGVFAVLKLNGTPSVDPGGVITDSGSDISEPESESSVSSAESSVPDSSLSENEPESSVDEYNYKMEHRYDNIVKGRYVYGETEIPDVHHESADTAGCVTHSPHGDNWEYAGLESVEFESHTVGKYTIRLVGNYVRTDKEHFPDRIFADSLIVEVEKNGVKLEKDGYYTHPFYALGSQFYPEYTILTDKIGEYLDLYDLEYPVIAMRYYYNYNTKWDADKWIDFGVITDEECLTGFSGECEPWCGYTIDIDHKKFSTDEKRAVCRGAIFEADEFKVVDKNTLLDEKASITYNFKFSDLPQDVLYTAEMVYAKYGEAEIPVVDWSVPYGINGIDELESKRRDEEVKKCYDACLDSIVFETHQLGEYKISLVGYTVWREEDRPGKIFANRLLVEAEKNGVKLDKDGRGGGYGSDLVSGGYLLSEYMLLEEKIGNYLDVYDMDVPVIVMKYFFKDMPETTAEKAFMFATIQEDTVDSVFTGECEEGMMVDYNNGQLPIVRSLNYKSEKFTIVNGNTLVDEEAGIRYTFDFSLPLRQRRYTAKWIFGELS